MDDDARTHLTGQDPVLVALLAELHEPDGSDGPLDPEDAALVSAELDAIRGALTTFPDELMARRHLDAISAVAAAAAHRRSVTALGHLSRAAAVLVLAVAIAGGLATTGTLPAIAQRAAADLAERIGITLPRPDLPTRPEDGVGGEPEEGIVDDSSTVDADEEAPGSGPTPDAPAPSAPSAPSAPIDAPPVDAPPVDTPPVDIPPVDAPPAEAPPVEVPPGERERPSPPDAEGLPAPAQPHLPDATSQGEAGAPPPLDGDLLDPRAPVLGSTRIDPGPAPSETDGAGAALQSAENARPTEASQPTPTP